jgi:hypothetical protein
MLVVVSYWLWVAVVVDLEIVHEQPSANNPIKRCNNEINLPSLQQIKTGMVNHISRMIFNPVPAGLHALPDF